MKTLEKVIEEIKETEKELKNLSEKYQKDNNEIVTKMLKLQGQKELLEEPKETK